MCLTSRSPLPLAVALHRLFAAANGLHLGFGADDAGTGRELHTPTAFPEGGKEGEDIDIELEKTAEEGDLALEVGFMPAVHAEDGSDVRTAIFA